MINRLDIIRLDYVDESISVWDLDLIVLHCEPQVRNEKNIVSIWAIDDTGLTYDIAVRADFSNVRVVAQATNERYEDAWQTMLDREIEKHLA